VARSGSGRAGRAKKREPRGGPLRRLAAAALRPALRWLRRAALLFVGLVAFFVGLYAFVNPPGGLYQAAEARRLGGIERQWVPLEAVAPVAARAAVAAEDANFCLHWGLDLDAIRGALAEGGQRGASTISQQVVKNVYLWHGRSWARKALEALLTPAVELVWSKRRILEVYLNVAEFDAGVFGIEAAARHYFGVSADALTPIQSARLAALLPDPKGRDAAAPSAFVTRRAAAILDGAATIAADGRADCFQNAPG
jgi:monofunctional biosynthetic peptidoglycan transglycosylase